MATETAKLEKFWRRWRGTRQDLMKLARQMEELALAAGSDNHAAHVKVMRAEGSSEYRSAVEVAERLPEASLDGLDSITMRVGNVLGDFQAVVAFHNRVIYLKVEGHGDKRLAVQGVFEDLRATIESGSRDVPHELAWGAAATLIGTLLCAVAIIGHVALDGPDWLHLGAYLDFPFFVVAWWFFWIRGLFVPHREILEEGDEARSERWARRTWKFVGWLLTLVAGGIIGALIAKWIS